MIGGGKQLVMKDVNEMTHKYAMECVKMLEIYINERMIPFIMKRDFDKEMEDIKNSFSIVEAFDCMEFEVRMVAMILDLRDAIRENPLLFFNEYQLRELLEEYTSFYKKMNVPAEEDDSLNDYDKSDIEQFICDKMNGW